MLALPALLTLSEAQSALAALTSAIKASPEQTIVIDAGALAHIDTSTLAVLLACKRGAEARQRGFLVEHAPPQLVELAKLYGVDALLTLGAA
jgi:phospholipid transport system transporter-binding protein